MTEQTESRSRACMTYAEVKPVIDEVNSSKMNFVRLCVCAFFALPFTLYIKALQPIHHGQAATQRTIRLNYYAEQGEVSSVHKNFHKKYSQNLRMSKYTCIFAAK